MNIPSYNIGLQQNKTQTITVNMKAPKKRTATLPVKVHDTLDQIQKEFPKIKLGLAITHNLEKGGNIIMKLYHDYTVDRTKRKAQQQKRYKQTAAEKKLKIENKMRLSVCLSQYEVAEQLKIVEDADMLREQTNLYNL